MSAADNMKCDVCGNNHHPMTECRDAALASVDVQRLVLPCPFRLLNGTDTIRPDDEFLTDDCQTWASVGEQAARFMIGKPYSAHFFQPMRRREYPTNDPAVDLSRLIRLVVEMREALEANRVFHTPLELRKHGGEWNEYQLDAIHRTRDALVNASYVPEPNAKVEARRK